MSLVGCAATHYERIEYNPLGWIESSESIYAFTACKDITLDPNGMASTTTPETESILMAVGGVLFGWWAF